MSSRSNSVRSFVERRWRLSPPKQVATTLLCSDASAGWQSLVLLSQPSPAGDSVLVEDPATLSPQVAAIRATAGGAPFGTCQRNCGGKGLCVGLRQAIRGDGCGPQHSGRISTSETERNRSFGSIPSEWRQAVIPLTASSGGCRAIRSRVIGERRKSVASALVVTAGVMQCNPR
jgi:hypothetical protein